MIKEKNKSNLNISKVKSLPKRLIKVSGKIDPSILMYDNYMPPVSESLARELEEAMLSFKRNKKTYTSDEVFKSLGL